MSDEKMRAYVRMLVYEVVAELLNGTSVTQYEQNGDGDEFSSSVIDADRIAENLWNLRQSLDGAPLRFSEVSEQKYTDPWDDLL